jgi:hypothetical protein
VLTVLDGQRSDSGPLWGNSCRSESGGDGKVGPEFDVMDNEKGLDGSRPITEAIATREGGDGSPSGGKGSRLRAPAAAGRKSAADPARPGEGDA